MHTLLISETPPPAYSPSEDSQDGTLSEDRAMDVSNMTAEVAPVSYQVCKSFVGMASVSVLLVF